MKIEVRRDEPKQAQAQEETIVELALISIDEKYAAVCLMFRDGRISRLVALDSSTGKLRLRLCSLNPEIGDRYVKLRNLSELRPPPYPPPPYPPPRFGGRAIYVIEVVD